MGADKDAHQERIHILLQPPRNNLFGGLAQTGINYLHPAIRAARAITLAPRSCHPILVWHQYRYFFVLPYPTPYLRKLIIYILLISPSTLHLEPYTFSYTVTMVRTPQTRPAGCHKFLQGAVHANTVQDRNH